MLDAFYNSEDGVIRWISRFFTFIIFLLFVGIYTVFVISKSNYAQAASFIKMQRINNLIR